MNDITYVGKHGVSYNVSRHAHESWEFVYCTAGSGAFVFDDRTLRYGEGDVVCIPPLVPHANDSEEGFQNIHINMVSPVFSVPGPAVISDEPNRFLLNAFTAALFHFYSDRNGSAALLSLYGDLISCILASLQKDKVLTPVVAQVENNIIANYADPDYELDAYLHSLPFSYDYLRKLFQRELGVTPHRYLIDKRLQLASELLMSNEVTGVNTISEIAPLCGFHDPLYLSKMFKKKYGVAPRSYQAPQASGTAAPHQNSENVKIMME